jgi:hypothetical protein
MDTKREIKRTKRAFCNYCKDFTEHEIVNDTYANGSGGDLRCLKCGSARLDTIQGFNANLM